MAETKKLIVLRCSDGIEFEVEEDVAKASQTIANMIEDGVTDGGIPLPNVTGKTMGKIVEYTKKHAESEKEGKSDDADLKNWDVEFATVDQATLNDMILAAYYLNIKRLLDLLCQTVAETIKGKTPEQICKHFNITNDFTPEEEEEIRRQYQRAFE